MTSTDRYIVVDRQTREQAAGPYRSRTRARAMADRLDLSFGGYRYSVINERLRRSREERTGEQMSPTTPAATARPLHVIARDIRAHWPRVYFGAVPYLDAMATLDAVTDPFGADSGPSIVRYFLANAQTWRGADAKRIKAELTALVKGKW